ncbi:MAG: helix-turn-helix transcriptional regulator [Symploca sp. SIO1C4]|uniref:Helix-turn-helix transcriptional regulator n=1 Tax=Symploca sp. SIO1C4 TaxID=2607765 RepID=A0A6B3NCZ6_9CYAN|nr:helix-turn-helix transcriptional regulator [Symploca sp. SIO1C4]
MRSRNRATLTSRSNSSLETLRIERTSFSQDELALYCEIPRTTYQRWISGKSEARPTIRQLKLLCQNLGIERIDELPDDFGSVKETLDDD